MIIRADGLGHHTIDMMPHLRHNKNTVNPPFHSIIETNLPSSTTFITSLEVNVFPFLHTLNNIYIYSFLSLFDTNHFKKIICIFLIMVSKRYHDDWAKTKSRDLVRDLIYRTILTFRNPNDIRVLFLPGIDAVEVFEIYDPLGIPRTNLIGLEMDPKIALELDRKNLGFEVVNKKLHDYLGERSGIDFDVVSLDYHGPINKEHMDDLADICDMQKNNFFVLHHANLLLRDRRSSGLYALGYAFSEESPRRKSNHDLINLPRVTARWADAVDKINTRQSLKAEKRAAYATLLKSIYAGSNPDSVDKVLRITARDEYDEVLEMLGRKLRINFGIEDEMDRDHPLRSLRSKHIHPGVDRLFEAASLSNIRCEMKGKPGVLHDTTLMALMDANRARRSYFPTDGEYYTYISESGAPMIGDIYFLRHSYKLLEAAEEVQHQFELGNTGLLHNAVMRYSKELAKFLPPDNIIELSRRKENRKYLGNSAKPVLTKERAIEEFKAGAGVDDVISRYRCIGNKPLAQWKAHVTMGSYDAIDDIGEDIDTLDRTDAIDLISSGIPVKEIYEAYPTSFSLPQLRAFKAHKTMGTYR